MSINYTTLLGLAKPVTGSEAGSWGDIVNDEITTLLEEAVARAVTINVTAGDVTLTTTDGISNQARNAALLITGTPGTSRNVIAPAHSKLYVVVNKSDSNVVIKSSLTTGVTVTPNSKAFVAWDGTDFVIVAAWGPGTSSFESNSNAVGTTDTQTISNKRINARVLTSTSNSPTPTLNTDNYDMMIITGQSATITSFTTNLSGTPTNGQRIWISITGTGAVGITWGASFESSLVPLPATTVATDRLDVGFVWNAATSKWRCVATA